MAMHYTASLPSMQAEWDGKVKWDSKKKEYRCPCPEKVLNGDALYRLLAQHAFGVGRQSEVGQQEEGIEMPMSGEGA